MRTQAKATDLMEIVVNVGVILLMVSAFIIR